jgi:hypothetical protein
VSLCYPEFYYSGVMMLIVIMLSDTMMSVTIESVVMLKVKAAKAGGYTGAPKNVLCRCNKDSRSFQL